jgi:hypothetical protein
MNGAMSETSTGKRVLRICCILIGLAAAAWTGGTWFVAHRRHLAWHELHGDELGKHQRIVKRFERRLDSKLYSKLPDEVYHNDALAAELATPIVDKLEAERLLLFETEQRAKRNAQIAVGMLVVLLVIARLLD